MKRPGIRILLLGVCLSLSVTFPNASRAQQVPDAGRLIAAFESDWPDLNALLTTAERAHGALYGVLEQQRGKVQEAEVLESLKRRVTEGSAGSQPDPGAEAGYAGLGARGAEAIRRTQAFHREILAIYAGLEFDDLKPALDAAVDRYLSRPDVAFPDVPKDMQILYDHPYTWRFKETYPTLNGFIWATHWLQLAALEPFEFYTDREERSEGLQIVTDRFYRKLKTGKLPDAFPEELPLAPPIAPGLVTMNERAAAIIDNMNMLHDVLADILVSPEVDDVSATLDQAVSDFLDPAYRVVEIDDWMLMALRHSIFNQGGPALGTMTEPERNVSGHAQHIGGGRASIPGMPY